MFSALRFPHYVFRKYSAKVIDDHFNIIDIIDIINLQPHADNCDICMASPREMLVVSLFLLPAGSWLFELYLWRIWRTNFYGCSLLNSKSTQLDKILSDPNQISVLFND